MYKASREFKYRLSLCFMLLAVLVPMITLTLVSCGPKNVKTTPQYQAAVTVNDVSSSLVALQQADIQVYHSPGQTYYPKDIHVAIESRLKQAAQLNDKANGAAANGDWSTAISTTQSIIGIVKDIVNNDIPGIKNPTTVASMRAIANGIIGTAELSITTWQAVQAQAAGGITNGK